MAKNTEHTKPGHINSVNALVAQKHSIKKRGSSILLVNFHNINVLVQLDA